MAGVPAPNTAVHTRRIHPLSPNVQMLVVGTPKPAKITVVDIGDAVMLLGMVAKHVMSIFANIKHAQLLLWIIVILVASTFPLLILVSPFPWPLSPQAQTMMAGAGSMDICI